MVYQIFLPMVLRGARASRARELRYKPQCTGKALYLRNGFSVAASTQGYFGCLHSIFFDRKKQI